MLQPDDSAAPLAWILTGNKGGDNAQMRVLAAAAGLRTREIPLQFNELRQQSNLRLGATLRSLTEEARRRLQPPWPDVVLSSGGRSVPIARWIGRQGKGAIKLVHIGRPWGRLSWFDLVLAMPQYGLPERRNVFQARMPFNAASAAALAQAADIWRPSFEAYPRPWIALIVGGRSSPMVFDAQAARELGAKVSRHVRAQGGSVLTVTSRRTGAEAGQALFAALDVPGLRWDAQRDGGDNPYLGVLALADEFIVTGDSASMLAEAVRMRRPVAIADLPRRPKRRRRRAALLRRLLPRSVFHLLLDFSLLTATRDLRWLHARLIQDGLATMLNGPPKPPQPLQDDLEEAALRVRQLLRPAASGALVLAGGLR